MPKTNLTQYFLLPNLKLVKSEHVGRFRTLHCETTSKSPRCRFCNHQKVHTHQYLYRELKDTVMRGKIHILKIKFKRFRCPKCKATFNQELKGILPNKQTTERMQREIYWACENFADLKKVRKHTTCGYKTIYKKYYHQLKLKQKMREQTPWPKTIGIDEHAFTRNKKRGHRDFVTLIVDYNNSKPRELLPTRSSVELQTMLSHIPGRENVKNITMDLSGTYRSFAKSFFPNASIVADHFHVVRLLHPAINRRRKQITGDKRKHPLRKLLLKNGTKLELFQRKAIYRWLEQYPELKEVYMAKEALHRLYRCRGYKRARSSLINLMDWLAGSQVEELKRLRRTLMNWKTEILNYFKKRITNAKTEGFNNVCKSIIKRAYGFRNFENYRLRVLNV